MHPLARVPAHRRQRRCARSNLHPQLAGTQDHRAGMVLLRAQRHRRRSCYPRSSPRSDTHATPFLLCRISHVATAAHGGLHARVQCIFLFTVPTLFLTARFCARLFHARTCTHAPAHTHAQERPTTNDATCGPPAWLTGRLHGGGIRSAHSPPRWAPLLATPIDTPLQGGRPERPDLFVS